MSAEGEFIDFDHESWDFDRGLGEMMTRGAFERNVEHLFEEIEAAELPDRVIHQSLEQEQALLSGFVERYLEQKLENAYSGDEIMTQQRFRQIALECFEDAYDQRELQAQILNLAALLLTAVQNPDAFDEMSELAVEIAKKEFEAELRIHHGLHKDNEWLLFFDRTVPVEGLMPLQPGDQSYLEDAQETRPRFESARQKKRQVIEQARELLGVNDADGDLGRLLDVTGDLINLHAFASAPFQNDESPPEREAMVRIFIAECDLADDPDIYERLVAMFRDFYLET